MKRMMRNMRCAGCVLCLFLLLGTATIVSSSAGVKTEQKIKITAELDRDRINIGDPVKLKITAEESEEFEVLFPDIPPEVGSFSFVSFRPLKSGWLRPKSRGREYLLTTYTTGEQDIPPVEVKYRKRGEEKWVTTESPRVSVEVVSLLMGKDTDIRDIKAFAALGMGWLRTVIIILAAGAVCAALLMLWRRKTRGVKYEGIIRKPSAYEVAYEQLKKLKRMNLPEKGLVKEYYVRLSDIVRRYLEDRFSLRAPEMTTEEFMEEAKRSPDVLDEHKELLKEFLVHCDLVKFAKYGPTPLEMLDSFNAAERLVDQTRAKEEKETPD